MRGSLLEIPLSRRRAIFWGGVGVATLLGLTACGSEGSPRRQQDRLLVPEQFRDEAGKRFDTVYDAIVSGPYLIDAGGGVLRTLFDPQRKDTALEVQAMVELGAVTRGDTETLGRLARYDGRYSKPNGLMSWHINADGTIQDETAVSAIMMNLAAARLLSGDANLEAQGRAMAGDIKTHLVDPSTHAFKAFDGQGDHPIANPAFWNPYFYEVFGRTDSSWTQVAGESRRIMGELDGQIERGEIAYYPNWIDRSNGRPIPGPDGSPPTINLDTGFYLPTQYAQEALYGSDPQGVRDARRHLEVANRFCEDRITVKDGDGKAVGFDVNRLLDGYNLDGSINTDQQRYPGTAFAVGAAMASLASPNPPYREYMLKQLLEMPTGNYPFNDYAYMYGLAALSGKGPIWRS